MMYVKGNTISDIDDPSRLELGKEKVKNQENGEDKILPWKRKICPQIDSERKQDKISYQAMYEKNVWWGTIAQ